LTEAKITALDRKLGQRIMVLELLKKYRGRSSCRRARKLVDPQRPEGCFI
jgi:hypothetical protein